MRGEGREEKGGVEGKGGLSGNVAEEAFCLKSAPAAYISISNSTGRNFTLWKGLCTILYTKKFWFCCIIFMFMFVLY